MKKTKIVPKIRALSEKIEQIKEQQRRLGLFCHDRELLSCPSCGLEEDVTFEGFPIVTNHTNRNVETDRKGYSSIQPFTHGFAANFKRKQIAPVPGRLSLQYARLGRIEEGLRPACRANVEFSHQLKSVNFS